MKRSWYSILLVGGLLALLGVLAVLQYVWLGQISDAEKDRISRRLAMDTERFGEDFNREISNAYMNFQSDDSLWQKKDWAQFSERYDFWREKTQYQDLIDDFYYFEDKPEAPVWRFDPARREFVEAGWTDELRAIRSGAADPQTFRPIDEARLALVMRIFDAPKTFERIMVRRARNAQPPTDLAAVTSKIEAPEERGFLVIKLDEAVVENQLLPDLAKKHFPEGDFNLAVTGPGGRPIFQTNEVSAPDSSARIFDLSPDNLFFFANRDILPRVPKAGVKDIVINQSRIRTESLSTVESDTLSVDKLPRKSPAGSFQISLRGGEKSAAFIRTSDAARGGVWTLSVQHGAGSLDRFIANTRNRNLGISFGILGLLAVSIVLIFVSAHRARIFAQRQIDFVSSVSHEFRTPLAVIYSAGENLADGVARENRQVSRYGELIKTEGKKLSAMVEQILDFAGADSGRKKYDFRPHDARAVIESALGECRGLIDQSGFTIERDYAENLPPVRVDAEALGRALQNLIGNSLKYSKPAEKWLKLSARNGGGKVRIVVEDRGIGIAPQDLKHIFEPFFRARAVVDEQIHGNGLGLSLVRETIEAHGGKISAASEPGEGSRFTIELPADKNGG